MTSLARSLRISLDPPPARRIRPYLGAEPSRRGCSRCRADAAPPGGFQGRRTSRHARGRFSACRGNSPSRVGRRGGPGSLGYTHIPTTCFRAPPRAGQSVNAESEPRLPVAAGARAAAHPTARVGSPDDPRRLSPRAVAVRLRNDRPGVTGDPPIHAHRRGGGAEMMVS